MDTTMVIDKKFFEENGFLIVKNVFSAQEIEGLRKKAYEQYALDTQKNLNFKIPNLPSQAKYAKGDLLSKEFFYSLLLDDRILKIARTILGNDDLIYFGDSSYQIGTGLRGFHRDNIDRTNLNGDDWKGEYSLIRIGVYLQDHKNYSGGLKIKAGSHRQADGKVVFVDSEVGDVVLWSLKTIHSGNAVRLKFFPNYSINTSKKESLVPEFLKKDQQHERISLFMTFALKSSHLNRYINEYTLKRTETKEHLKASVYTSEALQLAKSKGLEVLKVSPEQVTVS
jgi:hypothetical protein